MRTFYCNLSILNMQNENFVLLCLSLSFPFICCFCHKQIVFTFALTINSKSSPDSITTVLPRRADEFATKQWEDFSIWYAWYFQQDADNIIFIGIQWAISTPKRKLFRWNCDMVLFCVVWFFQAFIQQSRFYLDFFFPFVLYLWEAFQWDHLKFRFDFHYYYYFLSIDVHSYLIPYF